MLPRVCHLTFLEVTESIQCTFKFDFNTVHSLSHCSSPWGISTKRLCAFLTTLTRATCHCHFILTVYHSIIISGVKLGLFHQSFFLMSRYSPQLFVLIQSQSVFLPLTDRLSFKPCNITNNNSMMQSFSGEANSSSATYNNPQFMEPEGSITVLTIVPIKNNH